MNHTWTFLALAFLVLLTACGSPEPQGAVRAEPTATASPEMIVSPTPTCDPAIGIGSSDPAIVGSLEELVERSPIIMIGRVSEKGKILNTARIEADPTKPDPYVFSIGQVYAVEVEEYIRGSGAATLGVVNSEGFLSSRDGEPVDLPESEVEINCIKAADLEYLPLQVGARYLFFLSIRTYLDPEVDYAGSSWGHPWRFLLTEAGRARPESPHPEANELFPEMPSAEFVQRVRALIATGS